MAAPVRHLTPAELAERLGVPASTLRDWRRDGKGPAYIKTSAGRTAAVRYRLKDIEAWEESRLVSPAATA